MSNKKPSGQLVESSDKKPDPRVAGVATVGWITIAMLGVSIPIIFIVGSSSRLMASFLPLAIILGAGIMAVRIWSSGEKTVNRKENESLKARISDLEERLANLETVDSLEQHFAERHQASPVPAGETENDPIMGPAQEESNP